MSESNVPQGFNKEPSASESVLNRRQSYYHGKYNKEMLITLAVAATILYFCFNSVL